MDDCPKGGNLGFQCVDLLDEFAVQCLNQRAARVRQVIVVGAVAQPFHLCDEVGDVLAGVGCKIGILKLEAELVAICQARQVGVFGCYLVAKDEVPVVDVPMY
jgi:hypothetical protein